MSRDRPTEPPRAIPDQERGLRHPIEERKARQREKAEQLKKFSGAGFAGYLMATFSRGELKRGPQFVRRGYEASIIDELNDFFTWRGWRRRTCRPKITHKERQNHLRRAIAAGVIVRLGRGRYGLAKVGPK